MREETKTEVKKLLRRLTHHQYIEITPRGNSAIRSALSLVEGTVLIPEEGGWLEYKKIKNYREVKCREAEIDLNDLKEKLSSVKPGAFLYQNPGGYFAEQPMEEIYRLCKKSGCLVIVDVSGGIGTKLCNGNFADILVGSFGKWKLVNALVGGFISFREKSWFEKAVITALDDENSLGKIKEKLGSLEERVAFLRDKVKKVKEDLSSLDLVRAGDAGFVVVVRFKNSGEKEKIISYCQSQGLEWTECPRYLRINQKAISVEVKRLE